MPRDLLAQPRDLLAEQPRDLLATQPQEVQPQDAQPKDLLAPPDMGFGEYASDIAQQVPAGANRGIIQTMKSVLTDIPQELERLIPLGGLRFEEGGISFEPYGGKITEEHRQALTQLEQKVGYRGKTMAANVIGGIAQFAAPFGVYSKALSSAGIASTLMKSYTAGALADFSAFDPHEERLSNFIQQYPKLQNPVTEYLSAEKDDGEIEGRIKQVLEGGILGVVSDTAIRGFIKTLRVVKGFRIARKIASEKAAKLKASPEFNTVRESAPKVLDDQIKHADGLHLEPRVKVKATEEAIASVEDVVLKNFDESKRISKQVAEAIGLGEIDEVTGFSIAQKYGITPEEFAKELVDTASYGGRILNRYSVIAKRAYKTLPKEAADVFAKAAKEQGEVYALDLIENGIRKVENFRRGLLVTQLTTAVRNTISQSGRMTLSAFDEALQTAILGARDPKNLPKLVHSDLNAAWAVWSSLKRGGTKLAKTKPGKWFGLKVHPTQFDEILDSGAHELQMARLLSQPVHEVISPSKGMTWYLNVFNRTQEYFFRKLAFEAKLRQGLIRIGKNFDTVKPHEIPDDLIKDSVEYALEMSFARSPKSAGARTFINAWRDVGLTTVNPFPRFAFANALPFMWEHSPMGYLNALRATKYGNRALMRAGLTDLGEKAPQEFAKAASRATLGTVMLWSAWSIHQSKSKELKWYEMEGDDGKVYDIRSYAPFSTYLFAAAAIDDLITGENKISWQDYAQMVIGLNRISGSGLVIVDLLRSEKPETTRKILADFAGQYMGSFGVPFRTVKDIVAAYSTKEAIMRDTKTNPLWAPFVNNIPFLSQELPEMTTPFKAGIDLQNVVHPIRIDEVSWKLMGVDGAPEITGPIARQFFGVTLKEKNQLEREVDLLNLRRASLYARTGDKEADRLINGYTGYLNETLLDPLVASEQWKSIPEPLRKIKLKELLRDNKQRGTRIFRANHPDMALKLNIEKIDDDIVDFIGVTHEQLKMMIEEQP